MKNYVIVIAALIIASTMLSGRVNVNLQHNMHLPKELTNKTTIVEHDNLFRGNTYDIYDG